MCAAATESGLRAARGTAGAGSERFVSFFSIKRSFSGNAAAVWVLCQSREVLGVSADKVGNVVHEFQVSNF